MLRYCTVKLYPDEEQKDKILHNCHTNRFIYNYALDMYQTMYQEGINISTTDIINTLPELKKEKEWLNGDSWSYQNTIRNLNDGLTRFFKKQNSYPSFKRKQYISSGSYKPAPHNVKLTKNKIKIPKVGYIKHRGLREKYIKEGKFKSCVIKHNPDDSISCSLLFELPDEPSFQEKRQIGIDLGVKIWIQESTGKSIHQVDLSKEIKKLKLREQKRDKRRYKSKRHKKSQIQLNKIHQKIKNKKKDQIHKITSEYKKKGITVIHENINTSKMYNKKKRNLNKSIQEQNWYQFISILKTKVKTIEIEKAYTSIECSKCHSTNTKRENQSEFSCLNCDLKMNADYNAAINILNRGIHGVSLNLNKNEEIVASQQNLSTLYLK